MPQSGIDKRAVAKLMKDMQREFDKHPIRVPLETEPGSTDPVSVIV